MKDNNKILEVIDLEVNFNTYAGKVQAVRGVNFHLYEGETLAIVGESGCGKSVTSKSILGLNIGSNVEISTKSKILFSEKDILKLDEKELQAVRGDEISMIFQDPMTSLNPTRRIGKQLIDGLMVHHKITKKEALKKAAEMLALVNISSPEKRLKQYPHELSGGMRQRVMIAMSLICNPKILIADEPTTALDVTIQSEILKLISKLQKKLNTAVILITHDLAVVAEVAHRICVMYAGKVVESGTSDEIFYNNKHPYTKALLKSIPKPSDEHKAKLYNLEGTPPDLIAPPTKCPFFSRCEYRMNICNDRKPPQYDISETQNVSCWLMEKERFEKSHG